MSGLVLLLLVTGGGMFIALMITAAAASIDPNVFRLVSRLVCRPGEKLCIVTTRAGYHRPGERGLVIECVCGQRRRRVVFRTVFTAWLVLSLLLSLAGMLVLIVAP